MRIYLLLILSLVCLKPAFADMEADPLLSKIITITLQSCHFALLIQDTQLVIGVRAWF